jgi:hypothetical protein
MIFPHGIDRCSKIHRKLTEQIFKECINITLNVIAHEGTYISLRLNIEHTSNLSKRDRDAIAGKMYRAIRSSQISKPECTALFQRWEFLNHVRYLVALQK